MADYYFPTVVQPTIPNSDMTALEQLVLTHIFESEPDGDGLYFFAEIATNDQIDLSRPAAKAALEASAGVESQLADFLREQLSTEDVTGNILELDLSTMSWEFIFQDIVKRSSTLNHISVVTSYTCSKMRPDGFGGLAVLITAGAIKGKSTSDILADFLAEAEAEPPTATRT